MSSKYPNEFDEFQLKRNAEFEDDPDGDFVLAEDINALQDSIESIQKTLGMNPQGEKATVSERLQEKLSLLKAPSLTIYLGEIDKINGSTTLEESARILASFNHVVVGRELQPQIVEAIKETRKLAPVNFYGYVDAGVTTANLELNQIETTVKQWAAAGVQGIYLDNLGYGSEVSRERQNEILSIVHNQKVVAILNSANYRDVLTTAGDEVKNPEWVEPKFQSGDIYHYTPFAFNPTNGEKQSIPNTIATINSLYQFRKEKGIKVFTSTVIGPTSTAPQDDFDYAHGLALLFSVDAFHASSIDKGETTNKIALYQTYPLIGEWYDKEATVVAANGVYERKTGFGKIKLDEEGIHFEGISVPSSLIKYDKNSLSGEIIKDGTIKDEKIANYDGDRLIDSINAITYRGVRIHFTEGGVSGQIPTDVLQANVIEAINIHTGNAVIQQAKIGDLHADKITAGTIQAERISSSVMAALNLYASEAEIDHATINSALIGELTAEHIYANVIEAINLEAQTAVINEARIADLSAEKITAGDISADRMRANVVTAVNAYVENMEGNHAKFNSAVIGELTVDHIKARVIEAINLETQTAVIKEARIADLNASKITAGDIASERLTTNVVHAINADIQTARINEAKIEDLSAGKITAGDIHADRMKANVVDAVNLRAGIITSGAAIIDSAAIGTLSAAHIQANVISAINAYVGDLQVNKAKIGQLDADNIEANAITTEKLNADAVVAEKIAADAILARHIKADEIEARHIKANAITAGKIDADAITAREIQADAIETEHLSAGSVTADEIAADAITAEKILAGEIKTGHLAADSVTTEKIEAGAITADEIQADAINASHISADAIETEHITAGAVKADQIDAEAVVAGKIAADAVTATTIAAGAITTEKLNAKAVTADKIDANAVTADKIFAQAITTEKIAANAVTADKILADSIDATKIKAESITSKHIAANTISGDVIRSRTIHGDKIIAGTLSANILEAGSITSVEIAAKTITTRNIAAGAVDADIIRAGTITAGHISTRGLDAEQVEVYNGSTGQTLIKGGFLIVDGLDVGVVQSDNLVGNGLFLTASSVYGYRQDNPDGIIESREAILGNQANAQGGHQVWKVDLTNDIVLRKIEIPGRKPVDIMLNADEMYAYVTVQGDDTVVQMTLDPTNHGETLTGLNKPTGKGPGRIMFTGDILGDHKHIFVMNTDPKDVNIPDLLTIMDGPPTSIDQDFYVHHNIPIGNGPYDIVTSPSHHTYITLSKQGDIAMLDMTNPDSTTWKVTKNIPISAYGTDIYHGGLDGTIGFNGIVGGDSASKYGTIPTGGSGQHQHVHGGYGTSDGSLVEYEPRGVALSADAGHLYVADYKNNHLVIVDIHGKAPYNPLTGDRRTGNLGIGGNPWGDTPPPTTPTEPTTPPIHNHSIIEDNPEVKDMVVKIQAGGGHEGHGILPLATEDTTTRWVRYRIPIGDSPDFVKVVDGKVFITLEGSGRIAIINEVDILREIELDREHYANWNEFFPMRALPKWNVRSVHIGSKPGFMHVAPELGPKGTIFVALTGQNQIAVLDVETEGVTKYIQTGASPKGMAVTKDGKYLYIVNHGGGGELSFVYPNGAYIGDPYLGLEGGVEYQGAEHWVPSRSITHVDKDTGTVLSQAKVEFRVNEPFLNEGGYAKLSVFGKNIGQGTVFAKVEQDITSVTNYSNGNNIADVDNQRLDSAGDWSTYRPRLGWINGSVEDIQVFSEMRGETLARSADNKTFRPGKHWIEEPTKPLIFKGTTGNYVELRPDEYAIYYHGDADPRIVFNELVPEDMQIYSSSYFYKTIPTAADYDIFYDESGDPRITFKSKLPEGSWVTADFTHRDNRYWKPHNGSVLLAIENSSSPNFYTQFEIEEFVPKFISIDALQTSPFEFTPIHNPSRSNGKYDGIKYSMTTNRALGAKVTASKVPTSGKLTSIVDGLEPIMDHGGHSGHGIMAMGEEVTFASGLTSVTIDLGKKYMVGKINVMHAFNKNRKYHNTKTEVSEDGVRWVTVYDSAVSGEYNEFGPMDDHTHYGKQIVFNAIPVRYVRDWANGYTEYDANWSSPVKKTGSHWTDISVFADWEFEEHYKYPENTAEAGQQIATNGRGVVSTDISQAHLEIDIQVEFTSWWWMTYLVGPEFGQLDVEMPTVMGGSHSLFQDGTFVNKVAHRHIMSWPPSKNIKSNPEKGIKAGHHKAVIRQKSGKVTIDRFRFEDYQYLTKSSMDIPKDSSLNFTRQKLVPNQAQWYVGNDIQSTEGPYDTPRINTDTKLRDYSVPLKYRFIVIARMEPTGTLEERGTAYMTSAIFETGKLSSHWRMSQTQDSFSGTRIEAWDPQLPHKTGIQHFHLANGSVRGSKLMPLSVMNHHISPYARIHESKLDLNHATHSHGRTVYLPIGDTQYMQPLFISNKATLDSIEDWAGHGDAYGVENTLARGDHKHPEYVSRNEDGVIDGDMTVKGDIILQPDAAGNPGLVDGVDVSELKKTVDTHLLPDGASHPVAVPSTSVGGTNGKAGFISGDNQRKLNSIKEGATKTENSTTNGNIRIDGVEQVVYTHPNTDGNKHVPANGTTNVNKVLKATATAGTYNWGNVTWSELTGAPTSTIANIDDAAAKRHTQNTDTGTTSSVFTIGSAANATTTSLGLQFGNATLNPYIRWTGTGFEIYRDWNNGNTDVWSEIKALTFKNANGVEVSYVGHTHLWADITDKPATFTPPVATTNSLGGVKQGTNITISADGTISGAYKVVSTSTNGLMTIEDKAKLDGISAEANKYIHPASHPLSIITETATLKIMTSEERTKLANIAPNATNYSHPDTHSLSMITETSTLKIMTNAERTKLGEIEPKANNYIHPANHPLDMITETGTLKIMTAEERAKLANIQEDAINETSADGRYLKLAGGEMTGNLVIKSISDAKLVIHAGTDDDTGENGEPIIVLTQDNGITGAEIKLAQRGDASNTLVLAPFMNYDTTSPIKNYAVFIHDKKIWHEGSLSKSEFAPAAHVGTGGASHSAVTTTVNGFMIAEDKTKLNEISANATKTENSPTNGNIRINGVEQVVYTHPAGDGNLHLPATGTANNGRFLKAGATAGSLAWTQIGFTDISGNITDTQHGNRAGGALHSAVTTTTNGFMIAGDKAKFDTMSQGANKTENSTTNGSIKIDGVEQIVYTHPTGAGNNHVPSGGVSGNFLKWNAAGVAIWGNLAWSDIKSGVPTTFTPSAHTHTVSNITDFYGNVYTKSEVDTAVTNAGDIRSAQANTFTNTNTFTRSGLALKIQPATEPAAGTVMFQVNTATGNSLVTMGTDTADNQKARMVIHGDLEVTGATVQKLSQEIQGDMSVSGRLNVDGDVVLGDAMTDQTTIKGDLRLEGDFKPVGKSLEVARFAVYGIGGDLQFQSDSTSFEEIISHYSTFNGNIAGTVLPQVTAGAARRYRIAVAYSTVGASSEARLRVVEYGTTNSVVEFALPTVNGLSNGMVRHFVSPEFTTNTLAHTTFQAKAAGIGKDLVIKHIEVIAYDYYS